MILPSGEGNAGSVVAHDEIPGRLPPAVEGAADRADGTADQPRLAAGVVPLHRPHPALHLDGRGGALLLRLDHHDWLDDCGPRPLAFRRRRAAAAANTPGKRHRRTGRARAHDRDGSRFCPLRVRLREVRRDPDFGDERHQHAEHLYRVSPRRPHLDPLSPGKHRD